MSASDPFAAVADTNRRRLLEMLRDGPQSVGELAARFSVSRPAISQHLKILLDAGLVGVEAKGTRRLYSAGGPGLMRLNLWLDQFWDE